MCNREPFTEAERVGKLPLPPGYKAIWAHVRSDGVMIVQDAKDTTFHVTMYLPMMDPLGSIGYHIWWQDQWSPVDDEIGFKTLENSP